MRLPGFIGPTYVSQSPLVDGERAVNLYAELIESGRGKTSYGSGTMLKYKSDAANHQLEIQGHDGVAFHVHTDFLSGPTYNELQIRRRDDFTGIRLQFPDSGDPFISPGDLEHNEVNTAGFNLWLYGGRGSGTASPGAVYVRGWTPTTSGSSPSISKLGTTSTDVLVLDQNDGATAGAQQQVSGRIRLKSYAWDSTVSASRQVSFFTEVLPTANGSTPSGLYKVGFFHGSNVATYPLTLSDGGNLTILNQMQATKFAFNSGSAVILTGSGSPEGSNTAAVGSIYLRQNGGASTTLYVKESGSGNTGWKAVQTA